MREDVVERGGIPARLHGRWQLLLGLIACFTLIGCLKSEPETIVVTEVVVVEGAERVVTRLVRQTVAVTVTPNAATPLGRREPVTLDISFIGGMPNIDPQKTDDPDGINLAENLFAGLTKFNFETNEVEPELALEWEISEDGRTWTFHLRNDLFWVRPVGTSAQPDGSWDVERVRQVVASDVVYAAKRACIRDTGAPDAFVLYLIEGCEQIQEQVGATFEELPEIGVRAVDDFTLEFSLTQPASYFLAITSMSILHPLPRELIDELGDDWQEVDDLMTSGPFVLAPGSMVNERPVLHKNPRWPIPGSGNVDVVNIAMLNDAMQAFQLWQAKRLDLGPLPLTERQAMLESTPEKAVLVTDQTVFYLGYNFSSGVFREPEVRRALNAAIDRERLVEELFEGRALGARHLAPPGVLAAPPPDEIGKGYDPDYARQQMAESGFRSCRLMPPIRFLVTTSDLSLQMAELVREMWMNELECVEDQIIIEQVQFGTLLANTRQDAGQARPDIWELGWAVHYPDANNWAGDLLHCTDSENRQNRPCSEVDDLIRQAARQQGLDQRRILYRQIEDMFFGAEGIQPIIPLYVPGDYVLTQTWLSFTPALFGGERYDSYLIDTELKSLERSR
jgi:oligopeptide transport system substrate-binding protein